MKISKKVERYIALGNELFAYNTFNHNLYAETIRKYRINQSVIIAFCALGYIKKISRGTYSPVSVAMTPQMVDAIKKYYVIKRRGVEKHSELPNVEVADNKPSNKKINIDRLSKASDRQVIGVKAEASLKRFLYKRATGEKKTLSSYCADILTAHAKALKKHTPTDKQLEARKKFTELAKSKRLVKEEALVLKEEAPVLVIEEAPVLKEEVPALLRNNHVINANEAPPPAVKEPKSFSVLWGLVKFQF